MDSGRAPNGIGHLMILFDVNWCRNERHIIFCNNTQFRVLCVITLIKQYEYLEYE